MKHIILIGFKHVGKSTVGQSLAHALSLSFVDLDRELEKKHAEKTGSSISCRTLYALLGSERFRSLEHETLLEQLSNESQFVLALGGGTPILEQNQDLIHNHIAIHITSPKESVYERIMLAGKPAFLSPDENTYDSFSRVWDERAGIYENLASFAVENNGSIETTVHEILKSL